MNNLTKVESSKLLVSIITPSFMQGEFIEDTIRSIFEQTYKKIEHIIIDSCSTDQTDRVVKKYLDKYNLKYIVEKDNGQSDAINKGLELAKGDIVCWLNSDDYYFDDYVIEDVVNTFESKPNIDLLTADGYWVDKNKNFIQPIWIKESKFLTENYMKNATHLLQPSSFWKKNDYRLKTELCYTMDWDFFYNFYKDKKVILYVRKYYSCFRLQEDSKTVGDNAARKKEMLNVLRRHKSSGILILWTYFIFILYFISEKLHIKLIKSLAKILNEVVNKISNYKISSK